MTRRLLVRLVVAAVLLAGAAVVIPVSPFYLPKLLNARGQHDGHGAEHWIKQLEDPDVDARRQAIVNLARIGPEAAAAVPALSNIMLHDSDREARIKASWALWTMGKTARPAVQALAEATAASDPWVRMNATYALFGLRADARPALPALLKALKNDHNDTNLGGFVLTIRELTVLAIGRASAGTAEAVPALRQALAAAPPQPLRIRLAQALGEVGPRARPAAAQLRALRQDNNPEVKVAAEEALRKIGAPLTEKKEPDRSRASPDNLQLPVAEREYLWTIEHHGNLLSKHGWSKLGAALASADGAALARILAADFSGTFPSQQRRVRTAVAYAAVDRLEDVGHPPERVDSRAVCARLLELRKVFTARAPHVKVKTITLSPRRRGRLTGTWQGTAKIRMYGEYAPGAPAEVLLFLRYVVVQPTEHNLARPGWLQSMEVYQVNQAKSPHYLFAEVARERGLDASKLHDNWTARQFLNAPGGVFVCDFDQDGILDVLVTDVNGHTLYQGRPDGTFRKVTKRVGLPQNAMGGVVAAWVDIDGDGYPDLILGDRVYRNNAGKRFVDYTDRCNLRLPTNVTSIVVADYDLDGKLDLYVTRMGRPGKKSWLEGKSDESDGNYLYRNKGGWQFEDVTRASGTGGGYRSTFAAAWLDANNDGWPDLHVLNEFGDGVLFINNRNGTFTPHPLADRPADFGSMGLAVGDINNDGNIDIYCANMYSKAGTRVIGNLRPNAYPPAIMEKMRRFVAGSQLHMNRGGLKFDQAGIPMQVNAVGWAYGPCLADLDNDGWLDVYATAGFVSRDRNEPDG
jgi:hypothetical protein